jgi:hypothetical protein
MSRGFASALGHCNKVQVPGPGVAATPHSCQDGRLALGSLARGLRLQNHIGRDSNHAAARPGAPPPEETAMGGAPNFPRRETILRLTEPRSAGI